MSIKRLRDKIERLESTLAVAEKALHEYEDYDKGWGVPDGLASKTLAEIARLKEGSGDLMSRILSREEVVDILMAHRHRLPPAPVESVAISHEALRCENERLRGALQFYADGLLGRSNK